MQRQELKAGKKDTRKELAFLIISAVVTITIVSTCSPLYPFNPWDDANCFFTLGRGIIHGMVPYRDLYEQKGPLLYFLYAAAALISEKAFTGAWMLECIAASVYAVFSWKIVKLITDPPKYLVAVMPLFLCIVYTSKLFNFGGNAEELFFPLITILLYVGLKAAIQGDGLPSNKEAFLSGIITGALFWVKYTFIGFVIGFCLYILVLSIAKKDAARLWSLVWRFITGFIVISAPILLYFLANKATGSLWEAYFYNNIFLYHSRHKTYGLASIPVIKQFYFPINALAKISAYYKAFGVLMILTFSSIFFFKKNYRAKAILLSVITFIPMALTTFTRAAFIYYYGYIFAYGFCLALVPVILLIKWLEGKLSARGGLVKKVIALALIVFYILPVSMCKNLYLMFKPKSFFNQYRIAETINQTPDAKILTYKVMDSGYYLAAGVMPRNRYFCFLNIENDYPEIAEKATELINEGYFDYIVTSYFFEDELENYELVQVETYPYVDFTGEPILDGHKLYKRI